MGTKANPTVIGAFIVGAVVLIVAAIFVFGGGGWFAEKNTLVLYFEGSVNGLNVGAPVKFRGVKVGAVTDVRALYNTQDNTAHIQVIIEVEPRQFNNVINGTIAPANRRTPEEIDDLIQQYGLRAQLQTESFVTGLLFVALDFYPGTSVRLIQLPSAYQEIPTVPTTLEEVFATLRSMMDEVGELPVDQFFNELVSLLQRVNAILTAPEMDAALASMGSILREADEALAQALIDLPRLVAKAGGTADAATAALEAARATLLDTQRLVQHVDRQVDPLAGSTQDTLTVARGALRQARKTLATLEGSASPALQEAERALAAAADLVGSDSVVTTDLTRTLESLQGAARAIRLLAEYLERNPQSLLRGKGRSGGS